MRFAKTFCAPAATVSAIPAGLPIRLQYSKHGLLQKLSIGFSIDLDPNYEDPDVGEFNYNALFNRVKQYVPNTVPVSGGTTWVYGVLYSDRIPCTEGYLPQALYSNYISDIISGSKYEFYAGYVHSLAASYKGPLVVRNFLSSAKFNVLPQVVVPLTMSNDTLQMLTTPNGYPFKYAFIAGFFIFEDLNCRFAASNLLQITVTNNVEPFVDTDGYLKGEVVSEAGNSYIFNYSAILHHEVAKDCSLLLERGEEGATFEILSTRVSDGMEKVPNTLLREVKCPVCKKVYMIGSNDAPVQCDDPHCLSRSYDDAVKMLDVLNLPTLSYDAYKKLVDGKEIMWITDILELSPYKDQEIKTSLATAMYSVIPTSIVPDYTLLERFANKCNNKVETVVYYLNNPRRIQTDLDITDLIVRRFAAWLEDPYNVSTLTTIFSIVEITEKRQKFEGAPIFRGNTIAITGKFKRGDLPEIESILMSYSAKVVPSIEMGQDLPDVVLIGSLNQGVSGEMVHKAKAHNIPITYEDDFFIRYEIDKDMAQNLL